MSKANKLAGIIALIQGNRATTIESLVEAFETDYGQFARANNRDPLAAAAKSLAKSPKDKAIAAAMAAAITAGDLKNGYIGARTGPYADQPIVIQKSFDAAIIMAVDAFSESIEASVAFASKVEKTDEEKAVLKADKAEKAAAAGEALITAKIQSGELVRRSDVHTLADAGALQLAEALENIGAKGALSDTVMAVLSDIIRIQAEKRAIETDKVAAAAAPAPAAAAAAAEAPF